MLKEAVAHFSADALETIDGSDAWPNEALPAPASVGQGIYTVAGGFFASPAKATGHVSLLNATQSPPQVEKISTDKESYFYHHVAWADLDGSGRLLPLSARAKVPTVGTASGELVYFQPTGPGAWAEHVLTTGPDVFFAAAVLDARSGLVVVAAEFFTSKALVVYTCSAGNWVQCTNGTGVQRYIVDDQEEAGFFAITYVDVNNDGRRDLLATTNTNTGKGGVFVYDLTGDFRTGPSGWTKHELSTGYKPTLPFLPGRGAPGSVQAFNGNLGNGSNCKPWLLLSGDDAGFISILRPASESPTDWRVVEQRVYNGTGTVGTPAVGPFAAAGPSLAVVVPDYAGNRVSLLQIQ